MPTPMLGFSVFITNDFCKWRLLVFKIAVKVIVYSVSSLVLNIGILANSFN